MIVYLSGSTAQIERLRLAYIRIIMYGHTPICPILACRGAFNDVRLRKSTGWFKKIVEASIASCDVFVYLTEPCGCWQTKMERDCCERDMQMIPFDVFPEWLWGSK